MRTGAVAILVLVALAGHALAAEEVILSSKVKWKCEGDTQVHLNDDTGKLRIISKSVGVDETLPFYACHSSHCDWGPTPAAAECGEVPCAEMLASETEQSLLIRLGGF